MKDKIEKYLRAHKVATKAEIMAEFLIGHAELMPYLYELTDEGKISQKGDHGIRYIFPVLDIEDTNEKDDQDDLEDLIGEDEDNKDSEDPQALLEDFKDHLKKLGLDDIDEGTELIGPNDKSEGKETEEDETSPAEQLLQKKKRENDLIEDLLAKDFNIDMSDNEQYEGAVMDIIEAVTALDSDNTRIDAICICKELLRRARNSRWKPLFERAHKEFVIATDDEYEMLRKQIFGE